MRFFALALLFLTASLAQAQERVLSPEKARGIKTIITQCVSFTRVDFANAACDDLLGRIDPMVRAEGIKHIALGRTEWGFGSDVYLQAPKGSAEADTAHLTLYLRGADSPPAMFIWLSLYKDTPQGRLTLWEDSGLGSGDKPVIANGLSQGLAGKLQPVLKTIRDANKG